VLLSDEELAKRRTAWTAPAPNYTSGVMAKYAKLVKQADDGAVTG
jgi:dihydroxy-acid dehydratase